MTSGFPSKSGSEPNANGPTNIPASNSPNTMGSFNLLNSSANIFAVNNRIASEISTWINASSSTANSNILFI
jgi:hypothetical protein